SGSRSSSASARVPSRLTSQPSTSSASAQRTAEGWSAQGLAMPGCWLPWPGNTSATDGVAIVDGSVVLMGSSGGGCTGRPSGGTPGVGRRGGGAGAEPLGVGARTLPYWSAADGSHLTCHDDGHPGHAHVGDRGPRPGQDL